MTISTSQQQQQQEIGKLSRIPEFKRERNKLLRRFPGVLTRVAERCAVSKSQVSRVYKGEYRASDLCRQIRAALLRELNRFIAREYKSLGSGGNGYGGSKT